MHILPLYFPLSPSDTGAQTTHSSTTSSALNLLHLAGNLKNAQALLTALQKNLPQNATLANVKSIASKVLSTHPTNRPASQANGTRFSLPFPLSITLFFSLSIPLLFSSFLFQFLFSFLSHSLLLLWRGTFLTTCFLYKVALHSTTFVEMFTVVDWPVLPPTCLLKVRTI